MTGTGTQQRIHQHQTGGIDADDDGTDHQWQQGQLQCFSVMQKDRQDRSGKQQQQQANGCVDQQNQRGRFPAPALGILGVLAPQRAPDQ